MQVLSLIKKCIQSKESKLNSTFRDRRSLSTNEFYNTYYKDKGIPFNVVNGVKQVLESELDADLSRLSNKDDFSQNLSFFWDFDSLADVSIVVSLENFFSIEIEDVDAQTMRTIDDIIFSVTNNLNKT